MLLTRTRMWLIAVVAALAALGWFAGLGILPLAALTVAAVALILFTPRRIPVRDRPPPDPCPGARSETNRIPISGSWTAKPENEPRKPGSKS